MRIPILHLLKKSLLLLLYVSIGIGSMYAQDGPVELSPAPGSYSGTTLIRIESNLETAVEYRFKGSTDTRWVKYKYPLRLTALPGEERLFNLQVRYQYQNEEKINSYRYSIDRKAPEAPIASINEKQGRSILELTSTESNSRIKYWISSFKNKNFKTWNNDKPVISDQEIVKAFSVDPAGNQSALVTKKIATDTSCEPQREITLASPVKGTFANRQLLVLPNAHCFEWVRYSFDDNEPKNSGINYEKPTLIDKTGTIQLWIQAKPYGDETLLEKRLQFSVRELQHPSLKAFSAIEAGTGLEPKEKLPVPLVKEDIELYFSLNDTKVTRDHPSLEDALPVHTAEGMINYIPYRIGAFIPSEDTIIQYRYFYIVDNRIPPNPSIEISGSLPFNSEINVNLYTDKDAATFYTIDGSTPDRFSTRYSEGFTLKAENASKLGVIPLQAISRYPNGNTSEVVRKLLSFDRETPSAPQFKVQEKDKEGATIQVSHPDPDTEIIYAIGYGETPLLQINSSSPSISKQFRIDFPYGYQGRAFLRFAARDTAGNISTRTSTVRIDVDSIPPEAPVPHLEENQLSFESPYTVYYKLDEDYTTYSGPITLHVEENKKNIYRLSAFAQDESLNYSEKVTREYVIDNRKAAPPEIISLDNKTSSNAAITVRCIPPYSDALVYYKIYRLLGEAELPEETQSFPPDFEDNQYTDSIKLTGADNKEIRYVLKVRSYLPSTDTWSPTSSETFVIDKQPPKTPDTLSVLDKQIYSKPVHLQREEAGEENRTWVYAREQKNHTKEQDSEGTVTVETVHSHGVPLSRGLYIEGEEGKEKNYDLYFASFDTVGNSTLSAAHSFTIDRNPPAIPPIKGIPKENQVGGPLEIFYSNEYEDKVIYELSTDGGGPRDPQPGSPTLADGPLVLDKEGAATYFFSYRGMDAAGNLSPVKTEIIRVSAQKPQPPSIDIEDVGDQAFLIRIDSEHDSLVYAKINGGEFKPYTERITFYQSNKSDTLKIEAYANNRYGTKSEIAQSQISFQHYTQKLIEGIKDGGLYKEDLTITPSESTNDIRYELSKENYGTKEVTSFSPKLFSPISIDIPPGKTETFRLSVGIYDEDSDRILSTRTYRFTIDKTPPLPPSIAGIQPEYHYTEDQTVRIIARDEASIYFRTKQKEGSETPYRRYVQPEKVSVRPGTRKDLVIEAWSEDRAGNRSKTVTAEFVIDKESIYVASNGKDAFSGGKESPFRSIDRALYEAVTTHRNTIYLAEGEYSITNPLTIQNQLTLIGGLNQANWKPKEGAKTFLSIGDNFNNRKSLFTIKQGSLKLENLVLSNIDLENNLFVQEGVHSTLLIRNSELLHANGNAPSIIWSKNGNLVLHNSTIDIGPVHDGEILKIDNSSAVLRDCNISSKKSYGNLSLLKLNGTDIEILNTKLSTHEAEYIQVISALNTDLHIKNSSINFGSAQVSSTGIQQKGGKLSISDTDMGNNGFSAHVATGIEVENVITEMENINLTGNANLGLVQIKAKNSSINLTDSMLKNSSTREFSYLLRMNGGSCAVKNSELFSDSSYDITGVELKNDAVAMIQNSKIVVSRGESSTFGITIDGPVVCTLQDSTIKTDPGSSESIAVRRKNTRGDLKLVNNVFSEWSYILESPDIKAQNTEVLEAEIPPFDTKNPHRENRTE